MILITLARMYLIFLSSFIWISLLRFVKCLCLSTAETSGERSRLAAWNCIIHEVVIVTNPVVVLAF